MMRDLADLIDGAGRDPQLPACAMRWSPPETASLAIMRGRRVVGTVHAPRPLAPLTCTVWPSWTRRRATAVHAP